MPPNNLLYHRDLDKRSFWADWIAGRQSGRLYSPAGVPRGRITVWGTFQYRIRHLTVRSRKVSKARDKCLEVSDHSENCLASRQRCCRDACQISERYIYCIYIYIYMTYNLAGSRHCEILTSYRILKRDPAPDPMNLSDVLQLPYSNQ